MVGRGERNFMGNGKTGSAKRTREHLVMKEENYSYPINPNQLMGRVLNAEEFWKIKEAYR